MNRIVRKHDETENTLKYDKETGLKLNNTMKYVA